MSEQRDIIDIKYLLIDIKSLLKEIKKIQLRIEHNNTSGGQDA